jgi:transcriptional regulator with XRE-family HTH domain
MSPGELLLSARRRHGLSQRRLALRAGTTQAWVSAIERETAQPTVEMLRRLLLVMGDKLVLSTERLHGDADHDPIAFAAARRLTPDERLAEALDSMSLEVRMTASGPERIVRTLSAQGVDFIVIGGLAAVAHGSRRMTRDIDIVVGAGSENPARLHAAFSELGAVQLLGDGEQSPIGEADVAMVGLGTTLHTASPGGRLNVVGAPAGAAPYEDLLRRSVVAQVGGVEIRIVGLDDLVAMKRVSGRPLDLQDIADLTSEGPSDAGW